MDAALRRVIILMFVNLGLSVVTTIITLILKNSVLDYQIAHTPVAADMTSAQLAVLRQALSAALWSKVVTTVLVAALYIWRAFALRRGSRGAYRRLYWICIVGIIGIGYLIVTGVQYPIWMRVEQGLQALVLVGLLIAVSRREVRDRFAKPRYV